MKMNRNEFNKYYRDYILGVDLNNIEFRSFTYDELLKFLDENYYDNDFNKAVYWQPDGFTAPFGMYYLDYVSSPVDSIYMLGLVNNQKGTKTIVFCMIYDKTYGPIDEPEDKIGYISFIETNYFFRNKGVFKTSLLKIKEVFKDYATVVISPESVTGSKISIIQRLTELLGDEVQVMGEEEYFEFLNQKHKW